jgi:hypothetical protein
MIRIGTLDTAQRDSSHMCSLQRVHGRTGLEGYRWQITKTMLSRVDHDRKIRSRKQKTDIGKYSSVNSTTQFWNQLPADALETHSCKSSNFRKRVSKVINKAKWMCGGNHPKIQWSEVKRSWREVNCGEDVKRALSVVTWNEGKVMVKCECISSWHYVFHYCYCSVYSIFIFIIINLFNCIYNCICCSCNCSRILFIVYGVSFIVCVVLWLYFCLSVVCYFVWCVLFVLCLIVVPLPPGKTPICILNNNKQRLINNYIRWNSVWSTIFIHVLQTLPEQS